MSTNTPGINSKNQLLKTPSSKTITPARKVPRDTAKMESPNANEEKKAESERLLDELREQVRRAESASEEYQRELRVLKSRFDEITGDQIKLEDTITTKNEKIETLESGHKEVEKRIKTLEMTSQEERQAFDRERDVSVAKEDENLATIQRLKGMLMVKEAKNSSEVVTGITRTGTQQSKEGLCYLASTASSLQVASIRTNQSSGVDRSPRASPAMSPNEFPGNAHLILQKDHVIEALRLELAEAHIRLIESENAEAGRIQELERILLEARMNNARLMEDNESYQVLLRDKTLSGHFSGNSDISSITNSSERQLAGKTSLADELETAGNKDEPEYSRKLENELSTLKEQNKALTLYINKIITRLLQTESFETLWENNPAEEGQSTLMDKDAPLAAPSLLQRAGSVFGGRGRSRPKTIHTSHSGSGAVSPFQENVMPTIKNLDLEHDRSLSRPPILPRGSDNVRSQTTIRRPSRADPEWPANIVNNMYRGPPSGSLMAGSQISPGMLTSPRQSSYFTATPPPMTAEDAQEGGDNKLASTDLVSDSGYSSKPASETPDQPSPPRSNAGSEGRHITPTVLAATQGNKMRPLRLVQEKNDADEAALAERKKANRASFMGWFGKAP